MAGRNFDDVQILGKKRVKIAGSFRPNGTGAVDNTLNTGIGFSVVRDSAGVFTITLEDSFTALDSGQLTLAISAATDLTLQFGAVDVVTARTLVLRSLVAAVATDIASNAANRIHFELTLKNTNIPG